MLTFHNGNAYIGKTKHTITRRVRAHCSEARRGKGQYLIHKAIRKYGENFAVSVIYEGDADNDLLSLVEIEAIDKYHTRVPSGYNITLGGEGMTGRKYSDEERKAISDRVKKQYSRPEVIVKISASAQRVWSDPKYREETSKAISEASLKMWSDPAYREAQKVRITSNWQDPEYRAKQMTVRALRWKTYYEKKEAENVQTGK